jgi:hypothetical protein
MVSPKPKLTVISGIAFTAAAIVIAATPGVAASGLQSGKKFYPDDPLLKEPAPRPVNTVASREVDDVYDFLDNLFITPRKQGKAAKTGPHPARNVNTLGEVPDSPWYTNRHFFRRMSIEELKRGPGNTTPPDPNGGWNIVSAKTDGLSPGFSIEDGQHNRYLLKFDPPKYPEMASAADVIGSKIFYALGFDTPENYVVHFRRERLKIGEGVTWRDARGKKHPLTEEVVDQLLQSQPKGPDGTYRAMASRWLPGKLVGPFTYAGTRSDDPNDIVPHEDRRELRGLRVFAAWVNHEDTRTINSMDALITDNGVPYLKHYLLDFGSILGSAGIAPKQPWYGHEYALGGSAKDVLVRAVTLGLDVPRWERSEYRTVPGAGLFDWWSFDPPAWKPTQPNPAFLMADREDTYWGAKQVAAFTDEEIRALVETGEYSDARATDWITECLIKRRDRIAEAWLTKVLPVDKFRVENGELAFDTVGAKSKSDAARLYQVRWSKWEQQGGSTPLSNDLGRTLPNAGNTEYITATIGCAAGPQDACPDPVTVYLRRAGTGYEVVGIDR